MWQANINNKIKNAERSQGWQDIILLSKLESIPSPKDVLPQR